MLRLRWLLVLMVLLLSITKWREFIPLVVSDGTSVALAKCALEGRRGEAVDWSLLDLPKQAAGHCAESQRALQQIGSLALNRCSVRRNLLLIYLLEESSAVALPELKKPVRNCSGDYLASLYLGFTYWRAGQTADAVHVWQSVPDSKAYFLQIGYSHRREQNLELAQQAFGISGMIDANFALAHYWQGLTFIDLKRPGDAIPALQRALAADPSYVDAYWMLGRQAELLGQTDTALSAYRQLFSLPKAEPVMRQLALGRTQYMTQDWTGALASFGEVLVLQSVPAEYRALAHQYAAEVYTKVGDFEAAKQEWNRVIQDNPAGAFWAYMSLGDIAVRQGDDLLALEQYRRASGLKPGSGAPRGQAARVWLRQGQLDRAVEEARAAVKLEPTATDYYMLLGEALDRQGRQCEARDVYARLLSLDSDSSRAKQRLLELVGCGNRQ